MPEEKSDALSFVTKKVLVSFNVPIAIMHGETAVCSQSLICEYQDVADQSRRTEIPQQLTVVGFSDGRKLTKSLQLHVNWQAIAGMVEL